MRCWDYEDEWVVRQINETPVAAYPSFRSFLVMADPIISSHFHVHHTPKGKIRTCVDEVRYV